MRPDLGLRLRRALAHRGYSQSAFAAQIGVPISTLNAAVNGSIPRPERLAKICEGLQIPQAALQGPDDVFEAALAGVAIAGGVSLEVVLDSWIEDGGVVSGPIAWAHLGERGRLLDEGIGRRSAKAPPAAPTMALAGVPAGADILLVQASAPIKILENGELVDLLVPGDVVFCKDVAPETGRLVLAQRDVDHDEAIVDHESGIAPSRLLVYRSVSGVRLLWPLDGDPTRVELVDRGWEITGVVVERRRFR